MDREASAHKVLEENNIYGSEIGLEVIQAKIVERMELNSDSLGDFNEVEFINNRMNFGE